MRAERAARDSRHNKDHDNLKSSLKKTAHKSKKHRVVFNESANEFFEADYIIVVRDECGYSDEGEGEECGGCGACERFPPEQEAGALSPPEGYKDLGLFNRDGTLREQAWWEAGDVLLVGERSGTVFTPQHLQLLRRLQRERMLRSTICADCDAHAALHQPLDIEFNYEEDEGSDAEKDTRPLARRSGKHIAAGEERPRTNSSQQTTPTEDVPLEICIEEPQTEIPPSQLTSEESDNGEAEGRLSSDSSPLRSRRGGILKGGRLWKSSLDAERDIIEQQNEDQRSTTASDEDGSTTPRSVRFVERSRGSCDVEDPAAKPEAPKGDPKGDPLKEQPAHRLETSPVPCQTPKTSSAVQQLFNSGRPPPPAIEPQVVTSETLRAWDAGARPRVEEVAVRRVAERNALRCSLLRSETRKKHLPKQEEPTSLAERIRQLTCDVEDEGAPRAPPAAAPAEKPYEKLEKPEKAFDKSEKAFGSGSSSSSSSTLSAAVPPRHQLPPDLGDVHQEPQKPRPEPRRQFLSTLAPLTACVGSAAHHEGFYYAAPGDRASASAPAPHAEPHDLSDAPAPDVLAGTPGAGEGDDGLAAFARATAPRTERLRQRYGQESQTASSDDEHDDYGFHRRPEVRGITAKQLGSDDILQQMQSEMQPAAAPTQPPAHVCQRTNSYAWPYYSESVHNSRPQSRASSSNWSTKSSDYVTKNDYAAKNPDYGSKSSDYVTKMPDYVTKTSDYVSKMPEYVTKLPDYAAARACAGAAPQHSEACYTHAHNMAYAQYTQRQDVAYRNSCSLYANVGCSDSSQELYSSQTSSEQTSPVRGGRCRRAESPPPIRSPHQLLYLPYSSHYHYQHHDGYVAQQWPADDYGRMHTYYQQQNCSGATTPQPQAHPQPQSQPQPQPQPQPQSQSQSQSQSQTQSQSHAHSHSHLHSHSHSQSQPTHAQRAQYTSALQLQTLCPVPARYRPVPAAQPGGGKQMICYSEKVAAPLYQPAPGSPSRTARGAPEGAPSGAPVQSTASPVAPPPPNPVYYAMNV